MVKIFAFLELEPRLNSKYGFHWAGKIEHFSKVSWYGQHHKKSLSLNRLCVEKKEIDRKSSIRYTYNL